MPPAKRTRSAWHIRPLGYQESVKDPNAMRPISKGALIGAVSAPVLGYLAHQYMKFQYPKRDLEFSARIAVPLLASLGATTGASVGALIESDQIPIGIKAEEVEGSVLLPQKLATLRCTKSSAYKEANSMSLEDRVLLKMSSYFSDEDVQKAIAISQNELAGHKLASEEATVLALRDLTMQKLAQSFTNEELQGVIQQAEAEEQNTMAQPSINQEVALQLANTLGPEKVAQLVQQVQNEKEAEKIASYHYELGQIMGQGLIDKCAESGYLAHALTQGALPGYRSAVRGENSEYGRAAGAGAALGAVGGAGGGAIIGHMLGGTKGALIGGTLGGALGATSGAGGIVAGHAVGRAIGHSMREIPKKEDKTAAWNDTAEDLVHRRFNPPGSTMGTAAKVLGATALAGGAVYGAKKLYDKLRGQGVPHEQAAQAVEQAAAEGPQMLPKAASQSDIYQALAVLESAGIDTKKLL